MAATPISSTTRYYRPGYTKVYYLTAIGDYHAPTRPELDAGQDLSGEISAIDGWEVSSDTIDTPDLGSVFASKIPGAVSADDSSLTFYADAESDDVRALFPRGTAGFVVFLDEDDVAGHKMDVFPVTVGSAPKQRSLDDPAGIQVNFVITREPAENVTIPA